MTFGSSFFEINSDFDVESVSEAIEVWIDKWKVHVLKMDGLTWKLVSHDGDICYAFIFTLDFNDLEARIKLEDLRLNMIHYIESLKDDTLFLDRVSQGLEAIYAMQNSY